MNWNVRIFSWRIGLLIILAYSLLTGCAELPKQAFNARGATAVKKVVLVYDENQTEYEAAILSHPGMNFGLIGGLIAAADMQSKTTRFTQAIDPKKTRLQERFGEKMKFGLLHAGYQSVENVVVPAGQKEDQALATARQRAQGDMLVFVSIRGAYWAAGSSTDYLPRVTAKVKAVDNKSGTTLYEDLISYGYTMPQAKAVNLASDPNCRFESIDALVADSNKAREGLYSGIDAIVAQISADLHK
jgi:hypothetical protein